MSMPHLNGIFSDCITYLRAPSRLPMQKTPFEWPAKHPLSDGRSQIEIIVVPQAGKLFLSRPYWFHSTKAILLCGEKLGSGSKSVVIVKIHFWRNVPKRSDCSERASCVDVHRDTHILLSRKSFVKRTVLTSQKETVFKGRRRRQMTLREYTQEEWRVQT